MKKVVIVVSVIGVLSLVSIMAACSLNLGAEKLQLDAKTAQAKARKEPPALITVAERNDRLLKKVLVV